MHNCFLFFFFFPLESLEFDPQGLIYHLEEFIYLLGFHPKFASPNSF